MDFSNKLKKSSYNNYSGTSDSGPSIVGTLCNKTLYNNYYKTLVEVPNISFPIENLQKMTISLQSTKQVHCLLSPTSPYSEDVDVSIETCCTRVL